MPSVSIRGFPATPTLGIGANTAVFTIVNAVLLNPLPVTDGSRLYELETTDLKTQVALGNRGG